MKLHTQVMTLRLARPFIISRGAITTQKTVIVRLEEAGEIGYGEVTENDFYEHSAESILASIERVRPLVEACGSLDAQELWASLCDPLKNDLFALCAIDIAAHDLQSKLAGRRCHESLGLEWVPGPESSLTLSIGTPEEVIEEYKLNPGWAGYKLKLGTEHDLEVVRRLREETDAVLRIDANCAWSVEETIENSFAMRELGVEFLEQPLSRTARVEELVKVFEESALPVIADESCCVASDVRLCVDRFHGVNIKLCKCGGLTPAVRMLREARSLGLKTMVGCMIETSIGITAAAQLLPLLDYCDLDGALLLAEDPATGAEVRQGKVSLPDAPGCGGRLAETAFA
ncbi:L-Ala-D/L-Glu epimerase [Pseudobythopirellula maris]|uniref:Dipeptide epimerase n=1 Tax=Pseudobythopirellula maris TaxID=2527991 RepID=A0A5C5ZSB5_9BACT|nr:dipeptide epimerase [Pseudobythopirellula maris]TWT90389.1 L-Ala-D/L-Glu epimerase [Pseudobythopirellula maris]